MKAAIYLRVSTNEQTVEPQRIELRALCAHRKWEIVAEIEDTISGAKRSRAGLDRLMALVRKRAIGAVLCVKLDRLGRSLAHLAQLFSELETAGVALVIPGQGIDTSESNPMGKMMRGFLAVIAEFEREMISERTKAGLVAARVRGSKLGRPAVKLDARQAARLKAWRKGGRAGGIRALAKSLGCSVGAAHVFAKAG